MWSYDISSGRLTHDGQLIGSGYSGKKGVWRNNPSRCAEVAKGPLPPGRYKIGSPRTSAKTGPYVMPLTPVGHTAMGRAAFQIHGDDKEGDASTGCIILNRPLRTKIWESGDHDLTVTA